MITLHDLERVSFGDCAHTNPLDVIRRAGFVPDDLAVFVGRLHQATMQNAAEQDGVRVDERTAEVLLERAMTTMLSVIEVVVVAAGLTTAQPEPPGKRPLFVVRPNGIVQ